MKDVDPAIIRRFRKKVFVDLPSDTARADLIRNELSKFSGTGENAVDVYNTCSESNIRWRQRTFST